MGKYQIGIWGQSRSGCSFAFHEKVEQFGNKWLNKNIFLSNKNRDYDMQVKLQIYEGGSELERDHTGNGYQPDKNENQSNKNPGETQRSLTVINIFLCWRKPIILWFGSVGGRK